MDADHSLSAGVFYSESPSIFQLLCEFLRQQGLCSCPGCLRHYMTPVENPTHSGPILDDHQRSFSQPENDYLHLAPHNPLRKTSSPSPSNFSEPTTMITPTTITFAVPQGFSLIPIPQRRWNGGHRHMSSSGRNTINFTKTDRNCVMARDVLKRNYDGLICRDESMNLGGTSISLRFEWPGYKSWYRQIKTTDWTYMRKPITGSKLLNEIAKVLKTFIEKSKVELVAGANQDWKVGCIGSEFINLDNIAILALHRVSKGSWQVEFGYTAS